MNILDIELKLNRKAWAELMAIRLKRHQTKAYYRKLDEAIEMCKQHPRKYYVVQKSEAEWEILGSQEIRKMRKFKEAKHDENFMKLHETAPFVSPENIKRLIHERSRRRYPWFYLFTERYYKPLDEEELAVLKKARILLYTTPIADDLLKLIQKHEGA